MTRTCNDVKWENCSIQSVYFLKILWTCAIDVNRRKAICKINNSKVSSCFFPNYLAFLFFKALDWKNQSEGERRKKFEEKLNCKWIFKNSCFAWSIHIDWWARHGWRSLIICLLAGTKLWFFYCLTTNLKMCSLSLLRAAIFVQRYAIRVFI